MPLDFIELLAKLSPGYLFADPTSVKSPLYLPAAVIFGIVFVASVVALLNRDRITRGNRLDRRILERYATWGASLSASGLVVILLRYANVPLFSKRIWTVLNVLALFAVFAHFFWYRMKQYPGDLDEYREEERKRRFYPQPRRSVTTRRGRRRH
jgi:hypothetical protein